MNPVVAALGKIVFINLARAHPFVLVNAAGPAVTTTVAASTATKAVTPDTRGNIAYIARRLSHALRRSPTHANTTETPSMQAVESIVCPVCGFIAETTDASRLRTVWADHLLGGCGDDVTAITTAMESCIEQRQELWRSGTTDEIPGLTVTIDLLWEALRYARLAEPPVSTA